MINLQSVDSSRFRISSVCNWSPRTVFFMWVCSSWIRHFLSNINHIQLRRLNKCFIIGLNIYMKPFMIEAWEKQKSVVSTDDICCCICIGLNMDSIYSYTPLFYWTVNCFPALHNGFPLLGKHKVWHNGNDSSPCVRWILIAIVFSLINGCFFCFHCSWV